MEFKGLRVLVTDGSARQTMTILHGLKDLFVVMNKREFTYTKYENTDLEAVSEQIRVTE